MSNCIEVRSVSISRGDGAARREVLQNVSTTFAVGEISAVVGRSGSGKSTLLSLLASMLQPDAGEIVIPFRPRIGMTFQSDAVFFWKPTWRNLGYVSEIKGIPRKQQREEAERICRLVELDPAHVLDRLPGTLSGGERRRIALGMALSGEPDLLLLDEASSNLDWLIRRQMQHVQQKLWLEKGMTVITVTHDVEEAVFLSHSVRVMKRGGELKVFNVPFAYPRTDELRTDNVFTQLVAEIAHELAETDAL